MEKTIGYHEKIWKNERYFEGEKNPPPLEWLFWGIPSFEMTPQTVDEKNALGI
jgi:hypothetical protein